MPFPTPKELKQTGGIYIGDDAHRVARHYARYSHKDWICWLDANGIKKAARVSYASIKQAMLESGTQREFFLYDSNPGHLTWFVSWSLAAMFLKQIKLGHYEL